MRDQSFEFTPDMPVETMTDQELFEVLRTLVIQYGDSMHVRVLHEFRERFNAHQGHARQ